MNPLKLYKLLICSAFFSYSCINRHHSSWLLAYFPAIALKTAAKSDAGLRRILFFLTTLFTFSDPLQVLKYPLMSGRVESSVLDEGDRHSAGVPQDSF